MADALAHVMTTRERLVAHFAALPLGFCALDLLALPLAAAELFAGLRAFATRARVTHLLAHVLLARHEAIARLLARPLLVGAATRDRLRFLAN